MTTVRHSDVKRERGRALRSAVVADHQVYLSTDSSIPFYVQVAQQLTYLIYSRQLDAGFPLPSVRSLAGDLGVTSNTISQAYAELQSSGLALSVKGSGTYVRDDVFTQDDDWHNRNELAAEAVVQARRRIHSLGLGDTDLQRHVMGVMHGPQRLCDVAFVSTTSASAAKFAGSIDSALGMHGVSATGVTFEDLVDPSQPIRELLRRVYYVFTFVSTRQTVANHLAKYGDRHRVIGVSLELVNETIASLGALDPHLSVLIVTTDRYLDIALNVVQSNSRLDPNRIHRMTTDQPLEDLATRAAEVDHVIYTFGAIEVVEQLSLPEDRRLLIGFRIDEASFDNVAKILGAGSPSHETGTQR